MYHSAAMTWGRHSRILRVVCLRAYNALHTSPWFQYEFQWTTDGTSDDLCHGVAIACVADGGGEDLGEGQLAKLVVQIAPAHHRARHRHRQWPRAWDRIEALLLQRGLHLGIAEALQESTAYR